MTNIIEIDADLIVTDEHRDFYTRLGATIRRWRTGHSCLYTDSNYGIYELPIRI